MAWAVSAAGPTHGTNRSTSPRRWAGWSCWPPCWLNGTSDEQPPAERQSVAEKADSARCWRALQLGVSTCRRLDFAAGGGTALRLDSGEPNRKTGVLL